MKRGLLFVILSFVSFVFGAPAVKSSEFSRTPLHWAAHFNNLDMVKLLLRGGADPHAKDKAGKTPDQLSTDDEVTNYLEKSKSEFYSILRKGYQKIQKTVSSIELKSLSKNLKKAIKQGNLEGAKKVIEEVQKAGQQGDELLSKFIHFAIVKNKPNILRLLLQKGAEINYRDRFGNTGLHKAVIGKNKKIIRLLLKSGIDQNARNDSGQRAIDLAGAYDIEKLLKK